MPAVLYGKKQSSIPISISYRDFLKVWKKAGESAVVTLKEKDGKTFDALIHDVDIDPVTGSPRHADFYVFEAGHRVRVSVPLEFVGVAPGVKDHGGLLVKVLHEFKVEAMPKDLPVQLEVDISKLEAIGNQLLAKDIAMPAGVTALESPDEITALVAEPKKEKEEAPAEPVDLSAIEVEKKGKEKEGEEETAPGKASGEVAKKAEK